MKGRGSRHRLHGVGSHRCVGAQRCVRCEKRSSPPASDCWPMRAFPTSLPPFCARRPKPSRSGRGNGAPSAAPPRVATASRPRAMRRSGSRLRREAERPASRTMPPSHRRRPLWSGRLWSGRRISRALSPIRSAPRNPSGGSAFRIGASGFLVGASGFPPGLVFCAWPALRCWSSSPCPMR